MESESIKPGMQLGSWTVLDAFDRSPRGEKRWLCRCRCGTLRYVLERSLKYGESESCGCLHREKAPVEVEEDLLGKTFGDLNVVGRSRKRSKAGTLWTCLCQCGYTCDATAQELLSGKKTHCGCKAVKKYAYADITGQQFGRLTALYPTDDRGENGSVIWHCRCSCGKELDAAYNDLVYSNLQSCGCQKREHDQKLRTFLTHVDGTCIDNLKSDKIPTNNTTGVKGVYFIKGRYVAKIVFQKKQYVLGSFTNMEDAAAARKEAEEVLFAGVAEHYEKWKEFADLDPQWAKENPISVFVDRKNKQLRVTLLPDLKNMVPTRANAG